MENRLKRWTPDEARLKMADWCATQERCQADAIQRMRSHGLTREEAGEILVFLITEDFINEERYARAYARGHFNLKKWGRQKISYGLRQKQISDYCIQKALEEIDEDEHYLLLDKLAEAKWKSIGRATPAERWSKTQRYLAGKGFGFEEIRKAMDRLSAGREK